VHGESPDARDQSLRYGPRAYGDRPTVEQLLVLGRKIFFDPELSASGSMSCATCHSPHRAFGPANELPVQLGGPDMSRPGMRNPPSLKIMAT
jgi:cytochrome c peroxidase